LRFGELLEKQDRQEKYEVENEDSEVDSDADVAI